MRLRLRSGFTLVELLVAVLLIDVALLSLVAGGAVVVRRQRDLRTRSAAVAAGANRLQQLAAGPCVPARGAASPDRGIREDWSVEASGRTVRQLTDSVSFHIGAAERSVVLRARAAC